MFFLLRMTFWFSLVLLILPFGGAAKDGGDPVGPIETFLAAREAVTDLSGMCERKPDVCVVGKQALTTVGVRAKEAARIAYRMLDENSEEAGEIGKGSDTTVTGGIEKIITEAATATSVPPTPTPRP